MGNAQDLFTPHDRRKVENFWNTSNFYDDRVKMIWKPQKS